MDDPNATTLDLNVITPVPTVASPDDTIPEVPVQPVPENLISPLPTNPTPISPVPVSPTPTPAPATDMSPLVEDPDTVKLVGS